MKKVLMIILSMFVAASLFAGCSNVKNNESEPEKNEITEQLDNQTDKKDETENSEEVKEPEKEEKKESEETKTEKEENKKPTSDKKDPVSDMNSSNTNDKAPTGEENASDLAAPPVSSTPPVSPTPPVTVAPVEPQKPSAPQTTPDVKVEKTASEVAGQMISVIPAGEHNLEKIPDELYKDIYGVDKSVFESVSIFGTMISVKANEIIVVKVKNESDIQNAVNILATRKNQVYKTWEQYLPDQFEMVKKGVIKTNGKYAALIISPEVDKVANKFMELTK